MTITQLIITHNYRQENWKNLLLNASSKADESEKFTVGGNAFQTLTTRH